MRLKVALQNTIEDVIKAVLLRRICIYNKGGFQQVTTAYASPNGPVMRRDLKGGTESVYYMDGEREFQRQGAELLKAWNPTADKWAGVVERRRVRDAGGQRAAV